MTQPTPVDTAGSGAAYLGPIYWMEDAERERAEFLDRAALAVLPYALKVQADESEEGQDWLIVADAAADHAFDIADSMLKARDARRAAERGSP